MFSKQYFNRHFSASQKNVCIHSEAKLFNADKPNNLCIF